MPASSFTSLPTELICQVFQWSDDFSAVAALAQTARVFYNSWRENPTPICRAVAPRVLSNIGAAERLLNVQEEAEAESPAQHEQGPKSIIRAKRLLANARCASAASNRWVQFCQIEHFRNDSEGNLAPMRPHEIARFEHAFYCVWTIGTMAKAPHLQKQASAFLDQASPADLARLDELATWASNYNDNDFESVGLDLESEIWRAGYSLVSDRWSAWQASEENKGPRIYMASKYEGPIGFFAFFDHTQRWIDMIEENGKK
ncbi:hypothetical protein BU24DRAFT_421538 [Aaosphaeria arxii CBS 175.79]|uniref:F-box domain-containing protein n=1 Tax=Aaosphaeria arxii CBS 175.79 TaxID=1450172 RepID=A0A6A5XQ03_9PLEO|nr:uncharacterized protein BU24DRAFT_421538 [Aaosphaeria arxii CBS 175.79]KAF2015232.1 hypothetical protein BU24DRAFT_421538 [Aaosphaeria arxii CBS 175.79]